MKAISTYIILTDSDFKALSDMGMTEEDIKWMAHKALNEAVDKKLESSQSAQEAG